MLDFENCFSIEKLIIDNEICRMALKLIDGINDHEETSVLPLMDELLSDGHLLASEHTMLRLQSEHQYPGPVIERANRARWSAEGAASVGQRAGKILAQLLDSYTPVSLAADQVNELIKLMEFEAQQFGMDKLPERIM